MRPGITAVLFLLSGLLLVFPSTLHAGGLDFLEGIALGAGVNQATDNDADELYTFSIKHRETRWEYGLDLCMSEASGGGGDDNFAFVWGSWLEEFDRPDWQDYGIYVGAGAGVFVLEDDLIDWPAGPFVVLGWDFSNQAGLEGKVGYFGENYWGTALFYWYFE